MNKCLNHDPVLSKERDKTGITYQTSSLLKRAREATYMRAKVTKPCLLGYLTIHQVTSLQVTFVILPNLASVRLMIVYAR